MRRIVTVALATLITTTAVSAQPTSTAVTPNPAPALPCRLGDLDCIVDVEGSVVEADLAYESLTDRGDQNPLRAATEVGVALGLATAWYWIDRERQVADWDFPSVKQRLTLEAWRYDNNPFAINFLWHGISGTTYHLAARSNGLSLPASLAVSFAGSMAWEFLFEFREKVSVNDVIFTPASGVVMGEFFHWLGRYLESPDPEAGVLRSVARWTLGFPYELHRSLDQRPRRDGSHIWHQFEIGYSVALPAGEVESADLDDAAALHSVRVGGRLVAVPGYRRPGRLSRFFTSANFTSFDLEVTRGSGSDGSKFRAETVLLGHYRQDIGGARLGRSVMAGVAMAFDYRREDLGDWSDRQSLLHLPGPAVAAELHGGGWTLHTSAALHPDFVGLEALGHEAWLAQNPGATEKTILRKQGYYYGWCGSARLAAALETERLSVGGAALAGIYDSDEGLDRTQEMLDADVDLDDRVLELEGWLRVRPHRRLPQLEIRVSHQRRDADHDGIDVHQHLSRFGVGLIHRF